MPNKNLKISFTVKQPPDAVFAAINNVRGWWSEGLKGKSDEVGAEFFYRHGAMHDSTQKVTELVPGKRVVWHVIQSKLSFIKEQDEWNGTDVVFDIEPLGAKTKVTMTHQGLTPQMECFDACSGGWGFYVGDSLKSLIESGKGEPDPVDVTA